jgi:2-polyprenyl-3-methyl-5-hydroxy-6-metoxy-1,4-benzoquinol methylase
MKNNEFYNDNKNAMIEIEIPGKGLCKVGQRWEFDTICFDTNFNIILMHPNQIDTKNAAAMCWYSEGLANHYNDFFDKNVKGQDLSNTYHLAVFMQLLEMVPVDFAGNNLLMDVGTGTGFLKSICEKYGFEFHGCDLAINLDAIARRCTPGAYYKAFDVFNDSATFLSLYDVVVCNGFIDVMPSALEVFKKILTNSSNYIILHRQEITENGTTEEIVNDSYNGKTYHSIINRFDFNQLLMETGFKVIAEKKLNFNNWENGGHSFLLKKKK